MTGSVPARSWPTYLGLGATKAGTTLLHAWLADHPQVCVPAAVKEADFFSHHYERGWDWYTRLFRPTTEAAIGEFSVSYLESPTALGRIARDLPHVRCVVSLREPVARFESEYRHAVRLTGYGGDHRAFMRDHRSAVNRGRYGRQLAAVFDHFPRERVKVLVLEEVARSPRAAAAELYAFVGVDPGHLPAGLGATVNPGRSRFSALDRLANELYMLARRRDLTWVLRAGRSRAVRGLRGLNARGPERATPPIDAELAQALRTLYEPEVATASQLVGRDLAALWGPPGG